TTTITHKGLDWLAIGTVLFIAALFAIVARFNTQPATSLMPVAALSATGCGLLVTAIRKIRTFQRPGLLDAGIAGFGMAIFQFVAAITYPNVFQILGDDLPQRNEFLATWALVIVSTIVFSLVGAAIGHLAFAPFTPDPKKLKAKTATTRIVHRVDYEDEINDSDDDAEDETSASADAADQSTLTEADLDAQDAETLTENDLDAQDVEALMGADSEADTTTTDEATETETTTTTQPDKVADEADSSTEDRTVAASTPSLLQIIMSVFLLGLAPTIIAYVFSAAYDYIMGLFQLASGPYPTLRILSTLLPWQLPIPITFTGTNSNFITLVLWRIPLFLGNPTHFDFQALESVVLNGVALALLLLLSQGQRIRSLSNQTYTRINLATYLVLEGLFGLIIVLPSNLWIQRGLQGLLQLQTIVIPIRTLQLLDTSSFILNFLTAPVLCILIGLILWSQRTRRILAS
ncbi:MAG TPA: hypothetical protein VFN23_00470, partial [Ktedonobacteraceae bacterium]|nr:hypothetical protein [Ktedonobacteraceae bacterium]